LNITIPSSEYWLSKRLFMKDVRNQGGGVCPVRTFFCSRGRRINFSRFCADVFYRRPPTMKDLLKTKRLLFDNLVLLGLLEITQIFKSGVQWHGQNGPRERSNIIWRLGRGFAQTVRVASYGGRGLAKSSYNFYIACLHDQNKSGFFPANQSNLKFLKSPDWLKKSRPSKKPLLFWPCKQANSG